MENSDDGQSERVSRISQATSNRRRHRPDKAASTPMKWNASFAPAMRRASPRSELIELARKVKAVRTNHPRAPLGLAALLK
jgi:hypothetical protein